MSSEEIGIAADDVGCLLREGLYFFFCAAA
jgi:hypothetical protein